MDSLKAYVFSPDIRFSSAPCHSLKQNSTQVQLQQQPLPPFSEILPTHLHSAIDTTRDNTREDSAMTLNRYPQPMGQLKSSHSVANESSSGGGYDPFDNMSARSVEPSYQVQRHQRHNSSWTPTTTSSDLSNPYDSRLPYGIQTQYTSRTSPSLPPIRVIDRSGGYDQSYPPPTSPYSPTYGPSQIPISDGSSYATDRAYYDQNNTQRYGQAFTHTNRPQAPSHLDYQRYSQGSYDSLRGGPPYQSPYGPADYSPTSYGMHPSCSAMNLDENRNSRRRRGNLPRPVTDILKAWFYEHLDHPYPTEEDKQAFIARTGLTMNQISNWFINARRRQLPSLRLQRDARRSETNEDYGVDHQHRPQPPELVR